MKSPCFPFNGKCILFSSDFCQILPVVRRVSRGIFVFLSLKSSPPFSHFKLLKPKRKMLLKAMEYDVCAGMQDLQYSTYLLQVGEFQVSGKGELK